MSLLDSITAFLTPGSPYTVTRKAAGAYSTGYYAPGATTTFAIAASVQPVTGRDLRSLPEGQHAEESRVIYTATELRTRTPTTEPDVITIDGDPWEVTRVERWEFGTDTTHYRAYASRQVIP